MKCLVGHRKAADDNWRSHAKDMTAFAIATCKLCVLLQHSQCRSWHGFLLARKEEHRFTWSDIAVEMQWKQHKQKCAIAHDEHFNEEEEKN
jgi:hypothetical protein